MPPGHATVDHTADLALALWAASEVELLVEGARAVVEELTEGAVIAAREGRLVRVEALDGPDRLVRWLNEVLFLALTEGFLLADAEITLRPDGLDARLRGEIAGAGRIRHELKSVTYHDLQLEERSDGTWQARLVIDV